ncbi:hypothetical protein C0J52_06860 [Blattella germanica]|nr:hypothetical protein C0J52_06860 [Blattella germanica]
MRLKMNRKQTRGENGRYKQSDTNDWQNVQFDDDDEEGGILKSRNECARATETYEKLKQVYCEDALPCVTVLRWFSDFKEGRFKSVKQVNSKLSSIQFENSEAVYEESDYSKGPDKE